jgi:transcriptional regulator with XRE-family HTH domain
MSQLELIEDTEDAQESEQELLTPECAKKPRKEPTQTMLMIAARFKKARFLTGMTEEESIVKMGFHNKKVISQIENAHRSPTLHFLIRAANAYGVSADYLLGLSEDEDSSSSIAAQAAIFRQNENMVKVFAELLTKTSYNYAKTVGDDTAEKMTDVAESLFTKFNRFVELNPQFLDMRGGAPVQSLMLTLMPLVRKAKKKINDRQKLIDLHQQQLGHAAQRQLFGGANG